MIPCLAMYEPEASPPATHTCDMQVDHQGPHHCPRCDSLWSVPGGKVTKLPSLAPHSEFRGKP